MPSFFPLDGTRVTLSAELPFGHWAGVVGHLLAKRMLDRLRYSEGISYSTDYDVTSVGRDVRRLLVTVDGLPDRMQQVADGAVDVLDELARAGPTAEELAEVVTNFERQQEGATAVMAELARLSDDFLTGRPSRPASALREELRALTPAQVVGFVAAMRPSLLWSVPPDVSVPGCSPASSQSERRVTGSRWTPPRGQLQTSYVDVSDEGITFVAEQAGACVTVPWTECTALVAYDDGTRRLVGRDGFAFTLFPERWDRWDQLRAEVDRRVPAGRTSRQRTAPNREAPRPPVVEVTGTSDGAWITLSVVGLLFAVRSASPRSRTASTPLR